MQIFEIIDMYSTQSAEEEMPSFGADIDLANDCLFDCANKEERAEILLKWIKSNQPCILGRLAASKKQSLQVSVYVICDEEINLGDQFLESHLQCCRRRWKNECKNGKSDAVLYFFNSRKLARMKPSQALLEIFIKLSNMLFSEYAPMAPDVIYTEAAPLEINKKLFLFKAGINFFHTTAHLTANHDRRIPGGAVISINAVGHYANNLVKNGAFTKLDDAVLHIQRFAWQSIGNGGISADKKHSTSWHNMDPNNTCPMHIRPGNIKEGFSIKNYSANYHTDILVPELLTKQPTQLGDTSVEKWKHLTIEYFTATQYELGCIDFGMFNGYPVDAEALYFNPFPPIRGINSTELIY